jgi:ferrous iron transport protein A
MNTAIHTLADAPLGAHVRIITIHNQGAERRRLYDLGLTPGTVVQVETRSPLGDPTAYRVRDALIALRVEQACQIDVTHVENPMGGAQ